MEDAAVSWRCTVHTWANTWWMNESTVIVDAEPFVFHVCVKYTCTHSTRCTHMAKCSQIQKHVHMWIHAEHLVSLTGEQWAGTGWSLATMSCNHMSSCVSLPTGTAVCLAFYFTGQCHSHTYWSMHARTHIFIPQNVQAKGRILLKIGNEVNDAQNPRSPLVKRSMYKPTKKYLYKVPFNLLETFDIWVIL